MQLDLASGSYLNSYEKQVYKHARQGLPAVDTRIMQALLPMPDSTAAVSPVNYIILQMKFSTNLRENVLNRTITPQLGEQLAADISLCLWNTKSFYNLYSPLFNNLQQAAEESDRERA